LLKTLDRAQYSVPTPIQKIAISPALEGKDLRCVAQTGTDKTAAFAVPILQNLSEKSHPGKTHKRQIRILILTPARELALQIHESFLTYGRYTSLRSHVVYGGVSQKPQEMHCIVALISLWRHQDGSRT
jgi:ATP-dependent RNA helicase RhlE